MHCKSRPLENPPITSMFAPPVSVAEPTPWQLFGVFGVNSGVFGVNSVHMTFRFIQHYRSGQAEQKCTTYGVDPGCPPKNAEMKPSRRPRERGGPGSAAPGVW